MQINNQIDQNAVCLKDAKVCSLHQASNVLSLITSFTIDHLHVCDVCEIGLVDYYMYMIFS